MGAGKGCDTLIVQKIRINKATSSWLKRFAKNLTFESDHGEPTCKPSSHRGS